MISNFKFHAACVQLVCKRFAGHSKWQNIRHTKAAKDLAKGQIFVKLGQRIRVAIQESGSSDPSGNVKLQQALDAARLKNMPNATIQSYINQGKSSSDKTKTVYFDLKGPRGSFFIVHAITDTPVALRNSVASVTKRNSLTFENNLRHHFSHKGLVLARPKKDFQNIEELSVEHAIESSAEDVQYNEEDQLYQFICDPKEVKRVADKLAEIGYEIEDADDHFFPIHPVTLDDAYIETLGKAVEKINSIPGVIKVYDNIA